MTQNVQELINKIKSDGIQAAEQKAREIEDAAKAEANKVLVDARKQKEAMIVQAKEEINRLQESANKALQQSSRDTLLSLKKEIQNTLKKIVEQQVKDTLTSENLAQILSDVIKNFVNQDENASLQVAVSAKDLEKLQNGFVSKLQKQIKQQIKLQAADDIGKGFTISFDEGKSSFDFTDASLAEYLSSYLNAQVSTIVKDSV